MLSPPKTQQQKSDTKMWCIGIIGVITLRATACSGCSTSAGTDTVEKEFATQHAASAAACCDACATNHR